MNELISLAFAFLLGIIATSLYRYKQQIDMIKENSEETAFERAAGGTP